MSRVQLTKKEAKARIDEILEKQFDLCVNATYNELIAILNENAIAGKKRVAGVLTVGFNPMFSDENIIFDIYQKKEIVEIWSASRKEANPNLKSLERYTSRYDIFCWDYNQYYDFGFKFFTGFLPWSKTKTGKLFTKKLSEKLSDCGMKTLCWWNGMVTDFKICYSCNIPKGYVPKANINKEKMSVDECRKALIQYFSNLDLDMQYHETDCGAYYSTPIKRNSDSRTLQLDCWMDASKYVVSIFINIGRAAEFSRPLISKYNEAKTDDDFYAVLTTPTDDGLDGLLSVMKYENFNSQEDLFKKIDMLLPDALEYCHSDELDPLIKITYGS